MKLLILFVGKQSEACAVGGIGRGEGQGGEQDGWF